MIHDLLIPILFISYICIAMSIFFAGIQEKPLEYDVKGVREAMNNYIDKLVEIESKARKYDNERKIKQDELELKLLKYEKRIKND